MGRGGGGGGHWLNTENPDALVELLAHSLPAAAETADPRLSAGSRSPGQW